MPVTRPLSLRPHQKPAWDENANDTFSVRLQATRNCKRSRERAKEEGRAGNGGRAAHSACAGYTMSSRQLSLACVSFLCLC